MVFLSEFHSLSPALRTDRFVALLRIFGLLMSLILLLPSEIVEVGPLSDNSLRRVEHNFRPIDYDSYGELQAVEKGNRMDQWTSLESSCCSLPKEKRTVRSVFDWGCWSVV